MTKKSTELKVEIESLKSINIYFTGFVKNLGVNIVHPFSDIYTALIQSGGIDNRGSLRKIILSEMVKYILHLIFTLSLLMAIIISLKSD